jgi:hypothetical protein
MSGCPCSQISPPSQVKMAWNSYGMYMLAGALCCVLGIVIGAWATSDVKISITAQPKPCVKPVAPCPCPAPAPCPCKPKKPGDTGEYEEGPCQCNPCQCPACECEKSEGPSPINPVPRHPDGPKPKPEPKKCTCYTCPKCTKEGCKKSGCKDCKNCPGCKS